MREETVNTVRGWCEKTRLMIEPAARLMTEPIVTGSVVRDGASGEIYFEKKQGVPCLFFVIQPVSFC